MSTATSPLGTILDNTIVGTPNAWGTMAYTCDTKKWKDSSACKGIDLPWGENGWVPPDGRGTTAATGRWYRWLADAVTDRNA